jgi:diguanylate cyclase (GGDEF)-like protein
LRRLGLLTRFAVLGLALMALLGALLAHALQTTARERSLANATQTAEVVTRLEVQSRLRPQDLAQPLGPGLRRTLDAVLAASSGNTRIAGIKIWNADRRVVYSNVPHVAGDQSVVTDVASDELQEALGGETEADLLSGAEAREEATDPGTGALLERYGELLEVYVPIRFAVGAPPAGVFELYLPYAPIAAQIAHDSRTMYLQLLLGLGILYAGLYRIVASASTQLRRQAATNEHQALHDALTGLPNRALLRDRIEQAIRLADRELTPAALLLLDLDRFKEVNDTLDHHHGDLLLVQVGERLRAVLRDVDTVARLGGDEFAVLLPRIATVEGAMAVAEKLRAAFDEPFQVEGLTLDVEASVGVVLYPDHGGDPNELLQRADIAMYAAKQSHTGQVAFDPKLDRYSPRRLALLGELRRALDNRQLVVFYQPEVDARSGQVVGVEALVRWQHPEYGLLLPGEFIPLAERSGLVGPLTHYVLDAALGECRRWLTAGHELSVAVNISARRLLDLAFPDEIAGLLAERDVPAHLLVLEITESTIMVDPEHALEILARLSDMGVQLAIDDFGTGYSSMAYLKTLPVDELKVDRSFVSHMVTSPRDAVIVRSTVDLGRNLGLRVVAEGVQNEATWHELEALGCDAIQGFYVSLPLPADELLVWLAHAPRLDRQPRY